MAATARVFNNRPDVVIDGGGLVTLSGQGARRILYMNTCDPSLVWTTDHCQNQAHPTLTVQNLTFVDGDSTGPRRWTAAARSSSRGGRFKVVNSRFFGNRCAATGPDIGGASIQVFSQFHGLPVYVVEQHVRRGRLAAATVLERRRDLVASACRGPSSTACSPATMPSATAPTRPRRARRAAATAARSTTTATR